MQNSIPFAALALALTGCITETVGQTGTYSNSENFRTQGVIVREPIDSVWARVQGIVGSMTSEPLRSDGVPRSLRAQIGGAEARVLVEPYDAERTVVHVNTEDEGIRQRIHSAVLQGR